jgi:hypothetical protein|tara:strand:+ start:439 stop:831 length:393 start_codon:yes stop_codon:yes gene_type:complete
MYSLDQLFNQALQDNPIHIKKELGDSVINNGFKMQKFQSKIEILNCSRNGDYFQELNKNEYEMFLSNGWIKGCVIMNINNCLHKLKLIESKMRVEVNSRKNDKFIKNLKTKREYIMNRYSYYTKKLIKLN